MITSAPPSELLVYNEIDSAGRSGSGFMDETDALHRTFVERKVMAGHASIRAKHDYSSGEIETHFANYRTPTVR